MELSSIDEAIADIAAGKMVILVDDEDRENEGDLVIASEKVTPAAIDFMTRHARGLICVALSPERVERLRLTPVTRHNTAPLQTAFLNSIDSAGLGRPGISAQDRAHTIVRALSDDAQATDFVTPGFVFPLRARSGGVLVRSGQTEGSVDLARLAGLEPSGVICEVMNPDGTMSRLPELLAFGEEHQIKVVTVADLIEYRLQHETWVRAVTHAKLPTRYGEFDVVAYESELDESVHVALRMGNIAGPDPVLLRVHRADLISDAFGLGHEARRTKMDRALHQIAEHGSGVLLYLRGETTDDDLSASLAHSSAASGPRGGGRAPQKMAFHEFGIGAQILRSLGIEKLRVLSNSPMPYKGLRGFGLEIVEWVPLDPQ